MTESLVELFLSSEFFCCMSRFFLSTLALGLMKQVCAQKLLVTAPVCSIVLNSAFMLNYQRKGCKLFIVAFCVFFITCSTFTCTMLISIMHGACRVSMAVMI